MQRIPVSDLKAGMVLAKAVINESGMVLLSEGTTLTDSLITRLGRMDLTHVAIEGVSATDKSKEQMLSELEQRFKKTGNERHMDVIKSVIRARIEEVYK
ncbi:MAG TPA: hypothetical protein VMB78_04225 [Dissulfurispiraceae bacterium]|nr:hypothetical protein [Dissulfurispiraceae bacterium]